MAAVERLILLLPKTNKTDSVSYFERVQGRLKYEKNCISFFPFLLPVKKSLPSKHWVDGEMCARPNWVLVRKQKKYGVHKKKEKKLV